MKYFLPLLALGFAGCVSHQFSQPQGTWKTRTGQLLYREGGRSIVGELTVSTLGKDGRLEFSKGAALALMRIQRDASHARFEGPLARLAHTVSLPASPGSREAGWMTVMDRAATEQSYSVGSGGAQFSVQFSGGR